MKRGRKPTIEFDEQIDLMIAKVVLDNKLNLTQGFQAIADELGVSRTIISGRYYSVVRHKTDLFNLEEGHANVKVNKSKNETRKTYTKNGAIYHKGKILLLMEGNFGRRLEEACYKITILKAIPKKKG